MRASWKSLVMILGLAFFIDAAGSVADAAPARVDGKCALAIQVSLLRSATVDLCQSGEATQLEGNSSWSWQCQGRNGGNSVQCSTADSPESGTEQQGTFGPGSVPVRSPVRSSTSLTARVGNAAAPPDLNGKLLATAAQIRTDEPTGLQSAYSALPLNTSQHQSTFSATAYHAQMSACGGDLSCDEAYPLKTPLKGLISIGQTGQGMNDDNYQYLYVPGNSLADVIAKPNAFDGVVVNIPWAELQPDNADELNVDALETALANIRAYNKLPGITVPLHAILRIFPGPNAPNWAKSIGGPPITAWFGYAPHTAYTVGRFWADGYRSAWRNLLNRLGERYDNEPLISSISNTSCTSHDDEPTSLTRYFDQSLGVSTIQNLHDAGFTDAAYKNCLWDAGNDYVAWKTTPVLYPFGYLFVTDETGPYQFPTHDLSFPLALISYWRSSLGERGVFSNQNLQYPLDSDITPLYLEMAALGPQIEFQTHAPSDLNWPETVTQAVALGAHSLEIWNHTGGAVNGPDEYSGYVDVPIEDLLVWSHQLKAP